MWQIAALLGAGLGLWKSQYGAEGINNKLCVLCKKHYGKYGHNAQPLAEGRCCDACNDKVVAARMAMMFGAEGIREYEITAGNDYKWLKGVSHEGFYFTIVNSGKGAPYALIHRGYSWDKSKDDIKIPLMREGQYTWEAQCENCGGWRRFNENWCMFCSADLDCCDCEDDYDAEIMDATSEVIPPTPSTKELVKDGYMGTAATVQGYVTDWIPATWNAESVVNHKRGKVISMRGSDPRLRNLQKDKDISPEEARDRLEISAENSEAKCDFCDGWYCGNENWCMICATGLDCCRCDTPYPSLAAEFGAETFNAAVLRKKPKGYVGKVVAMDNLMTQARIEEAMLQLETAVKLGLISEDEIMEQLQRQFGSEEYAGNYMVPADIKSLARSVKVLQSKARADQNQPEWWKSKLSVVAAELDDLTDFFDYAEDTGML